MAEFDTGAPGTSAPQCPPGYFWDGSACVPVEATPIGDISSGTGETAVPTGEAGAGDVRNEFTAGRTASQADAIRKQHEADAMARRIAMRTEPGMQPGMGAYDGWLPPSVTGANYTQGGYGTATNAKAGQPGYDLPNDPIQRGRVGGVQDPAAPTGITLAPTGQGKPMPPAPAYDIALKSPTTPITTTGGTPTGGGGVTGGGGGGTQIVPPPGTNVVPPPGTNTTPPPGKTGGGGTTTPPPGKTGGGGTTVATPVGQGGGDVQTITTGILNDLASLRESIAKDSSPDVIGMYQRGLTDILKLLQQQEDTLRANADKEGSTMDPATQFALDKMKEQLGEQVKAMNEELNARGLFNSGIMFQLESNLRKGNLSDQARLMADRLSKIRDQLNANLSNLTQARTQYAGQAIFSGIQGQQQADQALADRRLQMRNMLLSTGTSLRGQFSQEQQAAAALAEQQAARQQNQSQFESTQAFQQKMQQLDFEHQQALAAARTQAEIDAANAKFEHDKQLLQMQINAGAYSHRGSSSQFDESTTNDLIDQLAGASSAEEAMASIQRHLADLIANKVDVAKLIAAIHARFPS